MSLHSDPGNMATTGFKTAEMSKSHLLRSNSRTRGINIKAVKALSLQPTQKSVKTRADLPLCTTVNSSQGISASQNREHVPEKPLQPPLVPGAMSRDQKKEAANVTAKQLDKLSIDDQLRLLALKEMSLVELKDSIATLNAQLRLSEKELQRFRQMIQRNLFREMQIAAVDSTALKKRNVQSNGSVSGSGSTRKPRSPSSNRKSSKAKSDADPPRRNKTDHSSEDKENTGTDDLISTLPPEDSTSSTLWSNISKPMTFIQNLEGMIQSEMENQPRHHTLLHVPKQASAYDKPKAELGALASLYPTTQSLETLKETLETIPFRDPEVMLQTVSSSLWSFVNEVKQNVLAPNLAPEHLKNEIDNVSDCYSDEEDVVDLSIYASSRRSRAGS